MSFPAKLFDMDPYSGQRPPNSLNNFPPNMRVSQFPRGISKEIPMYNALNFQREPQPHVLRQLDPGDPFIRKYESPQKPRPEDIYRQQMYNNNEDQLFPYLQQIKAQNTMGFPPLQTQPMKPERFPFEAMQKRPISPHPSLNMPFQSFGYPKEVIDLDADEPLGIGFQSDPQTQDLFASVDNARLRAFNSQLEDPLAQASLLNSLGYLQQLQPFSDLLGIKNVSLMDGLNPASFINSPAYQPFFLEQLQRECNNMNMLQNPLQQVQFRPTPTPVVEEPVPAINKRQVSQKPKKNVPKQPETILIEDSPEIVPTVTTTTIANEEPERERKNIKEEFTFKPSRPQVLEDTEEKGTAETSVSMLQFEDPFELRQNLNKRPLEDNDSEIQILSSPEKRIEMEGGRGVRVDMMNNRMNRYEGKPEVKTLNKIDKDATKNDRGRKEKPAVTTTKKEDIKVEHRPPMESFVTQPVKAPEEELKPRPVDKNALGKFQLRAKEPAVAKKPMKIQIEKISLPESATMQEQPENQLVQQSPTVFYLQKKCGQVQINTQDISKLDNQQQALQLKFASTQAVKVEKEPEAKPLLVTLQRPELVLPTKPVTFDEPQTPQKFSFDDNRESQQADEFKEGEQLYNYQSSEDSVKKRGAPKKKKVEPIGDGALEAPRRERKMNRLQEIKFAYQRYLEELRKPYLISIHIDPTNPDEKIVRTSVGERYQVDMTVLNYPPIRQLTRPLAPTWNPESIHPYLLADYYAKFEKIIGQKITNEQAAIKILQKFDMSVEKALGDAKRNQLYYQNYFRLDQRVLRNRGHSAT